MWQSQRLATGLKPLECSLDRGLEYLGSDADSRKPKHLHLLGVSKKTYTKQVFQRSFALHLLTPKLKAVLGTKPSRTTYKKP